MIENLQVTGRASQKLARQAVRRIADGQEPGQAFFEAMARLAGEDVQSSYLLGRDILSRPVLRFVEHNHRVAQQGYLVVYLGRDGELPYLVHRELFPMDGVRYVLAPRTLFLEIPIQNEYGDVVDFWVSIDPEFEDYLKRVVPKDRPIVWADTGFKGTIPKRLARLGWPGGPVSLMSALEADMQADLKEVSLVALADTLVRRVEHSGQRLAKPLAWNGRLAFSPESARFWAKFVGVMAGIWRIQRGRPDQSWALTNLSRLIRPPALGPGAFLLGIEAQGAHWVGTNLDGANLKEAVLKAASLEGASLQGARLTRADLTKANLAKANLAQARLAWAKLDRARLDRASLEGANLQGADLTSASVKGADATGADFREACLSGCRASEARFDRANMARANLYDADFRSASLAEANLSRASLQDADLRSACLQGARLERASAIGANLSGANLRGARARNIDLARANLQEANLQGADLVGACLDGADLSGADLRGADLRSAFLREVCLVGADLRGASLQGADLSGADMTGADLQGADLHGARI